GGQFFRVPCLGCAEFSAKKIELVEDFDLSLISEEVKKLGDVDLGFMCYRMNFKDHGIPKNNEWNKSNFSDDADAIFYRPHMIDGIIDVSLYRRELKC
ncbi:MAG: type I-C CRISPR-associated protein Cas5, partial [Spirochaetales bacterium]|nr:type I-C CRISPR-associated protein Cas5 [Spirochaetales bacterium]